jgi:hypothetical protein
MKPVNYLLQEEGLLSGPIWNTVSLSSRKKHSFFEGCPYKAIVSSKRNCYTLPRGELNRCAVVTSGQPFLEKIELFLSCRS